jgi:hypothetical protein
MSFSLVVHFDSFKLAKIREENKLFADLDDYFDAQLESGTPAGNA